MTQFLIYSCLFNGLIWNSGYKLHFYPFLNHFSPLFYLLHFISTMMLIEHPMVPLTVPLMHGMCDGAKIELSGTPFHSIHNGFTIELLTPTGSLLHLDVRFHQNCIVLNHFDGGRWHCEERFGLPFFIGTHFHLKIKNHPGHFDIQVNGMHIAHFHHRGSPHIISAFHIRGDVHVHKVVFEHFPHGAVVIGGGIVAPPVVVAPPPVVVAPPVVHTPPVVVVEGHHHHHPVAGAMAAGAVAAGAAVAGAAVVGSIARHHHHHRHW